MSVSRSRASGLQRREVARVRREVVRVRRGLWRLGPAEEREWRCAFARAARGGCMARGHAERERARETRDRVQAQGALMVRVRRGAEALDRVRSRR